MEGVELELERRSKFLNNLIQQKKKAKEQQDQKDEFNVRVRASDMPLSVQNRAFSLSRELLNATPGKADNKRLALALKKVTYLLLQNRIFYSHHRRSLLLWSDY